MSIEAMKQAQDEPVELETVYETIIQWDEGGGKRSRRELARRIVALYTRPQQPTQDEPVCDQDPYFCWSVRCQLGKVCKNARNQQPAQDEPTTWVDAVMEQAQVFASAWSLVGGRFDDGSGMEVAEEAKAELRAMLTRHGIGEKK